MQVENHMVIDQPNNMPTISKQQEVERYLQNNINEIREDFLAENSLEMDSIVLRGGYFNMLSEYAAICASNQLNLNHDDIKDIVKEWVSL